jgi:large subunit ribosomal protein L31
VDRPPVARNVAQSSNDKAPAGRTKRPTGALSLNAKLKAKDSKRTMKAGIHPTYDEVKVICACGSIFETRSTHKGDLRVEICSSCHPFFTGRQKLIDTEGRVDRFQKKFAKARELQAQKQAALDAKAARKKLQ